MHQQLLTVSKTDTQINNSYNWINVKNNWNDGEMKLNIVNKLPLEVNTYNYI